MDAINQLHKEMYESLAWREENGYKPANFNRWIDLCEQIDTGFDAKQTAADQLAQEYLRLKRKYNHLIRWMKAIGESETTVLAIPDEFYATLSIKQELQHHNNPALLWVNAMNYRNDLAQRNYLTHQMNLILNERRSPEYR